MPRKTKRDPLDFINNAPPWALARKERGANAAARVDNAIAAILGEDENVAITESQRNKAINDYINTGNFDLQGSDASILAPKPAAPTIQVKQPEPEKPVGLLDRLAKYAPVTAGMIQGMSDVGELAGESAVATYQGSKAADAFTSLEGRTLMKEGVEGRDAQMVGRFGLRPPVPTAEETQEKRESLEEMLSVSAQKAKLAQQEVDRLNTRLGKRNPMAVVARAAGSIAGQPEQLGPIAGGLVGGTAGATAGGLGAAPGALVGSAIGSLPMAEEAYNNAYMEARTQFGATEDEAQNYAYAMTGVEFGMDVVGGGLVSGAVKKLGLSKLTKDAAREGLTRTIRSRTARTLGAAAAEGATEAATELGGDAVRAGIESGNLLSSEDSRARLKKYNAEQTVTRLDRVLDAGVAGAMAGGGLAAPAAHLEFAVEAGKQEAETLKKTQENFEEAASGAAPKIAERKAEQAQAEWQQQVDAEVEKMSAPSTEEPVTAAPAAIESSPVVEEELVNDSEITDEGITALAGKLGLGMAADPSKAGETTDYQAKAAPIIKDLVKRNQQQTADVQNLLRQGKLILAPNPESVGREEVGNAAEFDPATGKMYVYLDSVDTSNAGDLIIGALHEATHGGQFNERDRFRPNILKEMMSPDRENLASQKIRAAASQGNKLAQFAIEAAQEASPNAAIQDLELVPYFVTAAAQTREYGRLKTVVNDIVGDVRNYVREKLGVPLDISINDIASASKRVAGEMVKTEPRPTDAQSLAMIGGEKAKGYSRAANSGRTYQGKADFMSRFEIPDNKAELTKNTETLASLRGGNSIDLQELLEHEELYDNYPFLKNMPVSVDPELEKTSTHAYFDPNTVEMKLNKKLLDNLEELRNKVLHEAQHAIQAVEDFVPGTNADAFMPQSTVRNKETAKQEFEAFLDNFPLDHAVNGLPADSRRVWENELNGSGATTDRAKKILFLEEGYHQESRSRAVQLYGKRYAALAARRLETLDEHEAIRRKAFRTYQRDYGETEARNTEHRSRFSDALLNSKKPEETMKDAEGNVAVEDTLDTTPYAGRRVPAESSSSPDTDFDAKTGVVHAKTVWRPIDAGRQYLENGWYSKATLSDGTPVKVVNHQDSTHGIVEIYRTDGYGLGSLSYGLHDDDGVREPPHVYVDETARRKGVATLMYKTASESGGLIPQVGAKNANRSPEGEQFRKGLAAKDILGMAKKKPEKKGMSPSLARRLPPWMSGLFLSSQGTGSTINEIVEYARSSPAGDRMIAEGTFGKYSRALNKLAAERGMTPDALANEITDKLDALDSKENSYEKNRAAFVRVAKQYGKAGEALIRMRDQVDSLSLDIMKQRAASGVPLSKAEKNTYKTVLHNLGRYSHRQYAIHMQKAGEDFASTIWKDYHKVENGKKVTPKIRKNYERVAAAVKRIIDDNLVIPEQDKLIGMSEERTSALYSQWGTFGNPDGLSPIEMKLELGIIRDKINGDRPRLKEAAENIVEEILGLTDREGVVSRYYRGQKLDRGILQSRKKIAPEIRDLMGEIKDPAMQLFSTVAKQAEFVARNKMMLELTDADVPQHIQPPNATGTPAVKGMQKLEGEGYGAMEGFYVSPNMAAVMNDVLQQLATFEQAVAMSAGRPSALSEKAVSDLLGRWGKVAAASKMLQIIYKPINFLYNFMGGPILMLRNGNINPVNLGKALKTAMEVVAYSVSPTNATEDAIRVTKYGITDSAFIGEIKAEQYQDLAATIKKMQGESPSKLWRGFKELNSSVRETYAMMDVTYKIANFYQQVGVLSDYYKAAGIERTEEQINREAADIVNRTNITYKRAAPLVKAIERGGLTNFGTYFWEVFRTEIMNVAQGINELRRAQTAPNRKSANVMRLQAAKRLSGQAMAWTLLGYASKLASQAAFGDDDEENDAIRNLLPDYIRNQDFAHIGYDSKGSAVFWDWSRIDPQGPATDIMRAALNEEASPEIVAKKMFDLYVAPRVGTRLIEALLVSAGDGPSHLRQPLVQQLAPEFYSDVLKGANYIPGVDDRTTKAWTNVAETFLPGIMTAYRDTNPVPLREDPASTAANLAVYAGASMYKLDPAIPVNKVSREYSDVLKDARRDAKDMFLDHPTLTEEEALHRVLELRSKEEQAWEKVRGVYDGLAAAGYSQQEADTMLKESGLSGTAIGSLREGRFKSGIISKESITKFMQNEQAGKTPEEKKEIKAKWDEIWATLEAIGARIEE